MQKKIAMSNKGKKTILLAIITIILCLSSIIGVTWSLFTSDLEDGTIGINVTSGKVQVDIVDTEGNSLVGGVLDFWKPDKNEKLYFEPGAMYYTEGFQVENIGSIPVNFRVDISEDEDMDMKKFKEAFDFWITTDPADRQTVETIPSFSDSLEVGKKSTTYYLVLKMKETAGNEFQNKSYKGIGITVYAVQGNVEAE